MNDVTPMNHTLKKSITKAIRSIPIYAYILTPVGAPTTDIPLQRAVKVKHIANEY